MSEELLVNVTPQETRVALVENGVLQEVHIERERRRGLVGNLYKGRVSRVLPGMQAAFVEIGLARTAFLHLNDLLWPEGSSGNGPPPITHLLHDGQEVLVQVTKDPLGSKGARLTQRISIPSRFLVYMPESEHIGISQRIEDEAERERLRTIIRGGCDDCAPGGYIVRTVAEGAGEEELLADMQFLHKLWNDLRERAATTSAPQLIHEDLPLALRILRDLNDSMLEKVRIDSRETFNKAVEFANRFIPELLPQIEHYPGERPLFDLYSVEDEIQRALERKVPLKSGGYLIFDQTEAMTTIDVNTGGFVGHRNLEETIFKTNLEASQAISHHLRLRNLGGIIIIDFIDMEAPEHRRQLLRALEKALERDRTRAQISEVSSLGLVEMTRKRTRESLEHVLCSPCPTCAGRGSLKTAETVCYEIFRDILRESRRFEAGELLVLAAQEVVDLLLDEESNSIAELEAFVGIPIRFQVESLYSREQFDVVPV